MNLELTVLAIFIAVRLLGAYLVQTSFVPDEYWQSLEVAHLKTFGYGYLTWEWKKKIRSYTYPFIFQLLYTIFPDTSMIIIHLPRIFQSIFAAIGDFLIYKRAVKLFGKKCGFWTVFNICTSWFLFYCSPRTITNMAEASFTVCGFYFYPWKSGKVDRLKCCYLWFAGASILIRPTGAVLWLPLYLFHVWQAKNLGSIMKQTIIIGCSLMFVLISIDYLGYGEVVFSPYNFFIFNWSSDIGAFYGHHDFLWYFTSGLPIVLSVHLMPFLMGLSLRKLKQFYALIFWVLLVFSVPSHKEFRFLLPIMHLCLMINGVVMTEISSGRMVFLGVKISKKVNTFIGAIILLINIPLMIYVALFHQRGPISAVLQLSEITNENSSVLFLMPCHSTPFYSYIHKKIPMRFLTCEPNFEKVENYIDEADSFFSDPSMWLTENYESNSQTLPSHIVMFDSLLLMLLHF